MVDASERLKGVDPNDILAKCKKFLGKGWAPIDESTFKLTVLTAGFGNRLFICEAKPDTVKVHPEKVLVRLYGGNVLPQDTPFRVLSEAGECIVFYALGEKGQGPKLHGVFKGGRIEEYIPSRLFTIEEFCDDPEISLAMARTMARYHTLDVPVQKTPVDLPAVLRATHAKHKALVAKGLPPLPDPVSPRHAQAMKDLIEIDLTAEADWFESVQRQIPSRLVFIHADVNRGNTLLKLQETDDHGRRLTWDERILFIDYEFSCYDWRCADIANHFCMQVWDFGQDKWLMHREFPSEERRRAFIREYIAECKRSGHFDDWDDQGLDSEDHILMECDLAAMGARLITMEWALSDIVGFAKMQDSRKNVDPEFMEIGGVASFVQVYRNFKEKFLAQYPQFA